MGVVAHDKTVAEEVAFDRRDGLLDARIRHRQKSNARQQQQIGVEQLRAVSLGENAELFVEAALAYVMENLVAQLAPFVERPFETERLGALDGAIVGDPRHDLRIGEVLRRPRISQMPWSGFFQIVSR